MGGSGLVLRGSWQGRTVAVKIWNGQSPEGFQSIRKEIRIYKNLKWSCSSMLVDAVPKMTFSWDNPRAFSVYRREVTSLPSSSVTSTTVVLVTELVGRQIIEDRTGNLWVEGAQGFKAISESERVPICAAAILSLSKLHSNGFVYGDICLRNLRIAKDTEEPFEKHLWRAWWVDLGQTILTNSLSKQAIFESEKMECISLFNVERSRFLQYVMSSKNVIVEEQRAKMIGVGTR